MARAKLMNDIAQSPRSRRAASRSEVSTDSTRRLSPRPWDHDYILMKEMAAAYKHLIAGQLETAHKLRIVDYGCGPMPYRPLFMPCALEYIGADIPGNPIADVTLNEDGALPIADGFADVVVSSQVLEHVLDVSSYLGECRRVLRPGGTLLLSTHGAWIYHPHPADVRRWTRWGLQFEVERAGFKVVEVKSCLGPLAYSAQLRLLLVIGMLRKLGMAGEMLGMLTSVVYQGIIWAEDLITPAWLRADNASVYVLAARRQ